MIVTPEATTAQLLRY